MITEFNVDPSKFYDVAAIAKIISNFGSVGISDRMGNPLTVFIRSDAILTVNQQVIIQDAIANNTYAIDPNIAIMEAAQYQRSRRAAYSSMGDQLDAIWKQLNQDRLGGKNLIQAADDELNKYLAVKAAHPKPA